MFRRMPALSASTSRRTAAARWPTGAPLPIPSTRLPYADGPTRCEGGDPLAPGHPASFDLIDLEDRGVLVVRLDVSLHQARHQDFGIAVVDCLLYTSPSPRD